MKVLFAVSNENISESIVKKYQKEYKEIISSKNVYYFNAIQKELQKDNTYDRIVISEDLEPFANNNYDAIDKFIFDKLDAISDEATNSSRNDTPIILICSDRRSKSEDILVKLFSIGIYDAVLGNDRSIDEICNLIKKPRTKKEAKIYYKIDTDDVKYSPENENEVSEVEIQNILSHYKKLGKNEDKYAESFESIASQYSEEQLKVIANILPLNVKAILETTSPKYQRIMTSSVSNYIKEQDNGLSMNFITDKTAPVIGNVIVPEAVNKAKVKKIVTQKEMAEDTQSSIPGSILEEMEKEFVEPAPKRKRGRPRKNPLPDETVPKVPKKRGRPRKNPLPEENINLFEISPENETVLDDSTVLPGFDNEIFENQYNQSTSNSKEIINTKENNTDFNIQTLLTGDKKLVAFVGTSKNGTSFLVNNVAQEISSTGINTAILDTTRNRNSYYIYTQNEEYLRNVASESIKKLQNGIAEGIKVNDNLTVYTAIPEEDVGIQNYGIILQTLVQNYDLVLIDCDFNTNFGYFAESQEIYLVQSLDVLTIQPLTAYLRDLKANDILKQEKIRVIINKDMKVRGLTDKAIIGGMSYYNEPAMSFMTELFDRDLVKYCTIPFETQTYSKYLEGLVNCKITLSGYSKGFILALKNLNNMVYPLIGSKTNKKVKVKKNKKKQNEEHEDLKFSQGMSDTLNQMKKNY